jgi:hypothetical protein
MGLSPGESRASASKTAAPLAANGSETRPYASPVTASDCGSRSAIPPAGDFLRIAAYAAFGV